MFRSKKRKFLCTNPMIIKVMCTSCSWSKQLINDCDVKTRPKLCPICKNLTKIIIE